MFVCTYLYVYTYIRIEHDDPHTCTFTCTCTHTCTHSEQVMSENDAHEGLIIEKEFKFDNHACSLPPSESLYSDETYVQPELAQVLAGLNNIRAKVSGFDAYDWLRHTMSTSLTGRVMQSVKQKCRPELITPTWLKVFELLYAYALVPRELHDSTMRTLHLCETGSTVTALNHFVKSNFPGLVLEWTAHHGLTTGEIRSAAGEERFIKETQEHWLQAAAPMDLTQRANVESVWATAKSKGLFHLVIADGHGEGEGVEAVDRETTMAPLMLAQMVCALGALTQGGSLVLRAGTLCDHSSVGIMYLVNCIFTEVIVARPCTASACMCEVYVVCKGYKGIGQAHMDRLLQAVGAGPYVKDDLVLAMMPKSFLSPAWLGQLRNCNQLFAKLQSCMIERDMRLSNKQHLHSERSEIFLMRDKAALHWLARFGCRPLNSVQDRITRDGASTNHMSAAQASAGGRIWNSLRGRFSLQDGADGGGSGTQNANKPAGKHDGGGVLR
jgi:cap2 methyltransferase